METKVTFVGRLSTLHLARTELDADSPDFMNHCGALGGLYRALSLEQPSIPTPFLSKVLKFYKPTSNTFEIGAHRLGITLEDVLFLAKLRINGKPVLVREYSSKHAAPVFGDGEIPNAVSVDSLYTIIHNNGLEWKRRKMALLMFTVRCFIMPSTAGLGMYPPFFELLSDPDSTSGTYAWGAAMLAYLQYHLENRGQSQNISGNAWLLVCFFLVRIPKLWDCLGLSAIREDLEAGELDHHEFPMAWIIQKVVPICMDRRGAYLKNMDRLFENLVDEDIVWTPYANWVLPEELQRDKRFVTRLGPIFCNNFVVHHKPHLVAKQFDQVEADLILDGNKLKVFDHHIRFVDNRGCNGHDYLESYKEELKLWDNKICYVEVNDDDGGSDNRYDDDDDVLRMAGRIFGEAVVSGCRLNGSITYEVDRI